MDVARGGRRQRPSRRHAFAAGEVAAEPFEVLGGAGVLAHRPEAGDQVRPVALLVEAADVLGDEAGQGVHPSLEPLAERQAIRVEVARVLAVDLPNRPGLAVKVEVVRPITARYSTGTG